MKTKFDTVQTANPGTGWTTLPGKGCSEFTINNPNSPTVLIRRADETSETFRIPAQGGISGLKAANLNEYQVKREDDSNTQVTLDIAYDA